MLRFILFFILMLSAVYAFFKACRFVMCFVMQKRVELSTAEKILSVASAAYILTAIFCGLTF